MKMLNIVQPIKLVKYNIYHAFQGLDGASMNYFQELEDFVSQLEKSSNIPAYFIKLCRNIEKIQKSKKQKKVGVIGDDFYCLYLRAFGLTPILLTGGSFYLGEDASHIFPQISDPVAKSTLGFLYNEDLKLLENLDTVIVSASNDSYKKIIYHLEKFNINVIKIDPPSYLVTKMPLSFISHQLSILNKLSKIQNTRLSTRKLKKEIKGYRHAHSLMQSEKWKTIPTFIQDFFLHTLYLEEDKELWCKELKKYLESIEEKTSSPILTLMGSPLRFPTSKIYKIFSDIGINHFNNECLNLPDFHDIPLKKISFSLLNSCFKYQYKKSLNARALVNIEDYAFPDETKAIIYYLLKGQVAEAYEAELIEKIAIKHDIPFLCIETDYTNSDNEQIKIRIEAFFEMLKSKTI